MIRKEVKCTDCGKTVVVEFENEASADKCYKKLCKECSAIHARQSNEKARKK